MVRISVVALAVALVVGLVPARADEEKKPADTSKEALAVLEKAIVHQAPKELTGPDAIRDLQVRIQAEVWDYRPKEPKRSSIRVRRYLTLDPLRFRSDWEIQNTLVSGFDGRFYWFAEYDHMAVLAKSYLLTGDTYKEDRQRIREEIDETRHLLRFFFLGNLKGEDVVFSKKPDETVDAFGEKACHVLHRVNEKKDTSEPPLTLWIEKKTLNLVRATAHSTERTPKSLRFTFRYDNTGAIQPRVKGVLFPFKMELHEMPPGDEDYRIMSRATLLENGISFNTGLDKAIFKAPIVEEKKKAGEK